MTNGGGMLEARGQARASSSIRPGADRQARFRVEGCLGQGGMGSVYRVVDLAVGEARALKRPAERASSKLLALFEREYHTLAGLKHAHIIEVYDYGVDADGPYYTMELLRGSDLSFEPGPPLPWLDVCRILRDLCSALALLHARRLIHRDISARNVWRQTDGRIKLIDFGALSTFGVAENIQGTLPFLSPEAVQRQALDQRTDLYSVGALAYFLLTGTHAFPAHSFEELSQRWAIGYAPASGRVRDLGRTDLAEIPAEFDRLIEALLSPDPRARPTSASELIDRLSAFAPIEPLPRAAAIDGHFDSKLFVGRSRDRAEVTSAIRGALAAKPAALIIEGSEGMGRTRLLQEIAIEARLASLTVLQADAAKHPGLYGVAQGLAHALLDAAPGLATQCAAPYASILGHLSATLRVRLNLREEELEPMFRSPGEGRMQVQAALCAWIADVSRRQPLAILVDDVERADDGSAAWLSALANAEHTGGLLLVSSLRTDQRSSSYAIEALRQSSKSLSLPPLSLLDMLELLRSLFGEAPHLSRLAKLLHRHSGGNPAHGIELIEHLLRSEVIRYVDGSWVLPQGIDSAQLPQSRIEALRGRLARLAPAARLVAGILSIARRTLALDVCLQLCELAPREAFFALDALVREGILTGSPDGYAFTNEALRAELQRELAPERAQRAHLVLGKVLLNAPRPSALERLFSGIHLLRGGAYASGSETVAQAGRDLALVELDSLGAATSALEDALGLLREVGRPSHEHLAVLAPLAMGAYYADRRLASAYGEETLALLQRFLGFEITRRLRGVLGPKLSLAIGLGCAALQFRYRGRHPGLSSFREVLLLLFNCVAALTAVSAICIDPDRARRTAEVLEPFTALGESHVATLTYRFCMNLAKTAEDRLGETFAGWEQLLSRLQGSEPVRDLTPHLRTVYLGGALYACGILECARDDPKALATADRLENLGIKLYEMNADQLRMMYYAGRGRSDLYEQYRERVEMHAIARGTAWQVETWTAGAFSAIHLRTYDAMRMKQCALQMEAISRQVPSLQFYARRTRGAYLLLRGRAQEALPWLEAALQEEPLSRIGWGRSLGALARAYNTLGAHARAKETCLVALSRLTAADLSFPVMNLILQIELAIAEASLGELESAAQQLDRLLDEHAAAESPLTLGALHEARARVASLAGDEAMAERHVEAMTAWYRRTDVAPLLERCERLRARNGKPLSAEGLLDVALSPELSSLVYRIQHGGRGRLEERAAWTLKQVQGYALFESAFIYVWADESAVLVATWGPEQASMPLQAKVAQHLRNARDLGSVTAVLDAGTESHDKVFERTERWSIEDLQYRVLLLSALDDTRSEAVIGALVMQESERVPSPELPAVLLHAMAARLSAAELDTEPESATVQDDAERC